MKCREFEAGITELVRADGTGSEITRERLAHAATCRRCGSLLEAERQLSADLRTLAAAHADQGAGAAVEQRLLTAFRSRTREQHAAKSPVATLPWLRWGAAVATLALSALGVYTAVRHAPTQVGQATQTKPAPHQPTADNKNPSAKVAGRSEQAQTPTVRPASPARARGPRRARTRPAQAESVEVVTAFYAIPYAAPLQSEEGGRIVRVSLPQSALANLGMAVVHERPLQSIQADVLVGEDNLARAIRFVSYERPVSQPRLRPVSRRAGS